MMFPMISSLDELREAKAVVAECIAQLKSSGIAHQPHPSLGVMIELPAAVEMIDALAQEAEFFSIGTNDLIQYTLAVDRTNEKVAELYVPHHPAVLRSLARVAQAALRHDRDISVCGDMAHEPKYISFLVGIGVRKFSLDARYLPKVQEVLLGLDTKEAGRFSGKALACNTLVEAALLFA
jgi:phosphotransferase system enzyme I (PtsP)